jgi:hypothetical protein
MHQHLSPSLRRGRGRKTYKMKYTIALLAGRNWTRSINEAKVSDAIAKKFNHEII